MSSKELDKSYIVTIDIVPNVHLFFRPDVYTFILRCIDLNFAYTDNLDTRYNFRNTEEYFQSNAFILKMGIYIRTRSVTLSIYESDEVLLTELSIKDPQINISMYLNN